MESSPVIPAAKHAEYDVAIIGGALSGGAAALQILRKRPDLRVLIIERSETFGRRVGEATVEVSGWFLGRHLGLTAYLNEHHLAKQGLRFWFANERVTRLDEASEVGPKYLARLPSYQVDRAALDQEVLDRAVAAGAELLRPAVVSGIRLHAGGMQEFTVKAGGSTAEIRARWLVDASGVAAMISRQEKWLVPLNAHPTASAWARWRGVKDWDGRELAEKFPNWFSAHHGIRNTATNHIIGDGWWSWWIPLKGGDVSVGVVLDQRLASFPPGEGGIAGRLKDFLSRHPVAKEMLEDAEAVEGDAHWRKNLPYHSTRIAGDGFALVGDAAGFIDPFYSPGMDWISFTTAMTAKLICEGFSDGGIPEKAAAHEKLLITSYHRWFDALYRDKYHYLGEYDLLALGFRLDLQLYYWGVVDEVFRSGENGLHIPPFAHQAAPAFAWLMKTYNRRFATIAARRRAIGKSGETNDRRRTLVPGFLLGRKEIRRSLPLLWQWLRLEAREGWKSWGRSPDHYTPASGGAENSDPA